MNRIEEEPQTNSQPAPLPPGCSDMVHRTPAAAIVGPPLTAVPSNQFRSRCWRTATEYSLHDHAPPNWWHRLWQRLLLGWRWESVVVMVVKQQQ